MTFGSLTHACPLCRAIHVIAPEPLPYAGPPITTGPPASPFGSPGGSIADSESSTVPADENSNLPVPGGSMPPLVVPAYLYDTPPTRWIAEGIAAAHAAAGDWIRPWAEGRTIRVAPPVMVQARPLSEYMGYAFDAAESDCRAASLPVQKDGYIVSAFRQGIPYHGMLNGTFVGFLGARPWNQGKGGRLVKDGDCVDIWAAHVEHALPPEDKGWCENVGMLTHELFHVLAWQTYHPSLPPWETQPVESGTGWLQWPACGVHPYTLGYLRKSPLLA